MEFRQTKVGYFVCVDGGCNASIHLLCLDMEVRIHYENHDNDFAHSHCRIPARPTIKDIADDIPSFVNKRVNAKGTEFEFDASQCVISNAMIRQPGTNYKYKKGCRVTKGGTERRYYCAKDVEIGCPAYGLEKKSKDGVFTYSFVGEHTHADEKTLKVRTPSIQAKSIKDEAFTLDTKELKSKKTDQSSFRECDGHVYWFKPRKNSKSTPTTIRWRCAKRKCSACIFTRKINGEVKAFAYKNQHSHQRDEKVRVHIKYY